MTPLTHAAVGTAIYQTLGQPRFRRFGWALAFPLAFVSHFLLDAIPHFEEVGPLGVSRGGVVIFLGLGFIGVILALFLRRWNREAGLIWLLLSLWIGFGSFSFPVLRLPTAILGLGYLAWKSKQVGALGYLLAGMLAVAPDLIPGTSIRLESLHDALHYKIGWATRLYLSFASGPVPSDWRMHLSEPYFLLGYGLELLVEGMIFFAALYLFSRHRFVWGKEQVKQYKIKQALELTERS